MADHHSQRKERGVLLQHANRASLDRRQTQVQLPKPFADWFNNRGWHVRPHQSQLLAQAELKRSTLLIAPTGAGKTLAGFLPSLISAAGAYQNKSGTPLNHSYGLRTLYISPLKALAVDVSRNLLNPIAEMGLPVRVEVRTGDTPMAKRQRQRISPPDILLTTPEQLALLLAGPGAHELLAGLETIILDELHALAPSKRGDLLALGISRLRSLAPNLMTTGLSATVAHRSELRAWLSKQASPDTVTSLVDLVETKGGAKPDIRILETEGDLPWASHTTRYAVREILAEIDKHRMTLVFVNTRLQAELMFHEIWRINEANLPIALHHGSLDVSQRRKVEAAMASGRLRAVVATSTLDLGIDWGEVDLVLQIGAPKGASRFTQRIGRANHRLDEPSKAILVPSNRFEVLECRAALDAANEGAQDAVIHRTGALDVLAQHILGTACSGDFDPETLFGEVRSAAPYSSLTRREFDRVIDFVSTGGYALRSYERFARLRPASEGRLRIAHPMIAQQYRLNVGTIVESPMLKVRQIGRKGIPRATGTARKKPLAGGRVLGELDEFFAAELKVGDAFVFGGQIVRLEGIRETEVYVSPASARDPIVPSYPGGRFPLSTHLAARVRAMLASPEAWPKLPKPVAKWLQLQADHSIIPRADEVLVETFPRANRHHLAMYPFEGRLAHQTLGMLLTRRLERLSAKPMGFLANDYALQIWGLADLTNLISTGQLNLTSLLEEDMLGDDLEAWLAETSLLRRSFRQCATIAGLIERRHPGKQKSGRQMTVSSDLIFDVLRRHDPHHIMLEATYRDAATSLLDVKRLQSFLTRIKGHIRHVALSDASPLSIPLLLEMGRVTVNGEARDEILRQAADELLSDAQSTRRVT